MRREEANYVSLEELTLFKEVSKSSHGREAGFAAPKGAGKVGSCTGGA